ncbi:unnamed protein product [Caenorhabditis sp. 36 PRJEB53466]|nr:unnamed protein product [Caenorhabditis sp. 36 PRJEB53466]
MSEMTHDPKDLTQTYSKEDQDRLLTIVDHRITTFVNDIRRWLNYYNGFSKEFFEAPLKIAHNMVNNAITMKEILRTDVVSVVRLQKLALNFEIYYHDKYMPLKYSAINILQHGGWTNYNLKKLDRVWRNIVNDRDIEERVVLPPRPRADLRAFIGIFNGLG